MATEAFRALGNRHRLTIFRTLLQAAPDGLTAGQLCERMGMAPSGLSFHLGQLANAGLLSGVQSGRHVHYVVEPSSVRDLLGFLADDCCGGRPELCGAPLMRKSDLERSETMADQTYNVLFLCTGNSARSIIAEAILAREGQGRFRSFSAGSQPKGEVHPYAMELLKNLNHDVSQFRSKDWDEFAAPGAPEMNFVFTVCDNAANEVCPVWPGQPMTAHWGIPDPAAVEGSEAVKRQAFADTYRMMNNRISIFVNLPLASLDRLRLQQRLDEIGGRASRGAA
ncbi:MAG: metalloregulator ArsR/SmtB family transcription factor [Minwuia sp.]|uniref:metalloregulator ArsR/SmtB family transcription factor n=1 Tax=Minwuia sp. TaxID=2493630 RepID=UPI003A87ABAD